MALGTKKGKYFVKVIVNNYFIPSYQYVSVDQAYVTVSDSNTPKLNALIPFKSEPGSLITLNGDFKVKSLIFLFLLKLTHYNLIKNFRHFATPEMM